MRFGEGLPTVARVVMPLCVLASLTLAPVAVAAPPTVPMPKIEGPIKGGSPSGHAWWATPYDLRARGYVEKEYFLSGIASDRGLRCPSHTLPDPLNGLFGAGALGCEPGGEVHRAPYKVRILVRRPIDPADLNGSALLEWANVSLQMEIEHDWAINAPMMMREGFVSAMISVQQIGVQGPGPFALKNWAPKRYESLRHPGDRFAFDIYAQAARALRSGRLTRGTKPTVLIGSGTSQSCIYLNTYIPLLAKRDRLFDAFMPTLCPAAAEIPADLVPIVFGTSESEAQAPSRSDGRLLRVWEIPGSHINYYEGSQGQAQIEQATGTSEEAWDEDLAGQYGERGHPLTGPELPGASVIFQNTIPTRYAFRAALHHLNRWAVDWKRHRRGRLPAARVRRAPKAERFARSGGLVRLDVNGNAVGGVSQPAIDVPVATYMNVTFGGTTIPFDPARLLARYPTHAAYVGKMQTATDKAVAAGHMLRRDAREWMKRVKAAPIGT